MHSTNTGYVACDLARPLNGQAIDFSRNISIRHQSREMNDAYARYFDRTRVPLLHRFRA